MTSSSITAPTISARVYIAMGITIVAWASAFIVIRAAVPYFTGGGMALGRLVVGVVVLAAAVAVGRKWVRPNRTEWVQIIGFGVLWFGAYNVALNVAEQTLDAGTTAMIVNIGPILIALGAGLFLGEGIPKWLAIGAGVAFVGVVLIGIGTSGGRAIGDGVGVFWALVAAVTYAAGVLLQKPALKRLPNAQVTFLGCAIGLLACLPFAGELVRDIQVAPLHIILGIVYLGAVPTALAFSLWAYALYRVPAGQLGVSTYIVPPLAIVMGFAVFGEVPAVLAIVGGVICLAGVALSRRRRQARPVAEPVSDASKTVAD